MTLVSYVLHLRFTLVRHPEREKNSLLSKHVTGGDNEVNNGESEDSDDADDIDSVASSSSAKTDD